MPVSPDCAAALLPQIDIQNLSRVQQNAWLVLITQSNYESVKHSLNVGTGGAAGLPIAGLPAQFSGFFNGSYEDFQQKRSDYLSLETGEFSEAISQAIFRQSLTGEQLQAWTACVTQNRVDLTVQLSDDSEQSATLDLYYNGTPGTKAKTNVTITNGSVNGKSKFKVLLVSGGHQQFDVIRSAKDADIKVIANSPSLADSAVSVWPPPKPPAIIVDIHHHTNDSDLISQGRPTTTSGGGGGGAAVDGNPIANWNSGGFPPQWIQIMLDGAHDIDRVVLIPEQTPSGVGKHVITGRRANGAEVVIDEHTSFSGSGSQITILAENNGEGYDIVSIKVETVSYSPASWVSWREIQVYGWKL